MERGQACLALGRASDDNAVKLHTAHRLGTFGFFKQAVEQRLVYGTVGVAADGPPVRDGFHFGRSF